MVQIRSVHGEVFESVWMFPDFVELHRNMGFISNTVIDEAPPVIFDWSASKLHVKFLQRGLGEFAQGLVHKLIVAHTHCHDPIRGFDMEFDGIVIRDDRRDSEDINV